MVALHGHSQLSDLHFIVINLTGLQIGFIRLYFTTRTRYAPLFNNNSRTYLSLRGKHEIMAYLVVWKIFPFCSPIKPNSWSIHFFAMEVRAGGYCASTMRSCLMRLGFTRKLVRYSLKTLGSTALTASFKI